jgi:hypothetical protein
MFTKRIQIHITIYIYIYIYIYEHVCMYVNMCVCVRVFGSCKYVCMYINTHTHTYMHICASSKKPSCVCLARQAQQQQRARSSTHITTNARRVPATRHGQTHADDIGGRRRPATRRQRSAGHAVVLCTGTQALRRSRSDDVCPSRFLKRRRMHGVCGRRPRRYGGVQ